MNQAPRTEADIKPAAPRKKFLRLWIFLAFLFLLIALPFSLLALWLKPWNEIPPVLPTVKDFVFQTKLMRKVSRDLYGKKVPERSVLRLSPAEVNSLFKLASNYKPRGLQVPIRYLQPTYDKGVFSLTYPVRLEALKLPDKAIYLQVSFKVSKETGKNLAVTLISIKANGLNIPDGIVKKAQAKLDAEMKKLQEDAAKILDKISVENGNLVLFYNPQALMFQLMGKAMR